MIAESQIREKLGRYLRGDVSLDSFEDWLVERSWGMHKDSQESAQRLASAIELRLAEHSSGHLGERELKDELRQFANPPVVEISFGNVQPAPQLEPATNDKLVVVRAQVFSFIPPPQGIPSQEGVVSFGRQQLVGSL
jgi:hypothetical protein